MNGRPFTTEIIDGVELPRVFNTAQIGRICGVSARTVVKWMETDKSLPFYRVPLSQDRRVGRTALVEFLKAKGLWDSIPLVSRRLMGLVSAEECGVRHVTITNTKVESP